MQFHLGLSMNDKLVNEVHTMRLVGLYTKL